MGLFIPRMEGGLCKKISWFNCLNLTGFVKAFKFEYLKISQHLRLIWRSGWCSGLRLLLLRSHNGAITKPSINSGLTPEKGTEAATLTFVPSTPAPLTLEQQHLTTIEGIVPTLQCCLNPKTIALHTRNAKPNPKVRTDRSLTCNTLNCSSCSRF